MMRIGEYVITDWVMESLALRSITRDAKHNNAQKFEHISVYQVYNHDWVITISCNDIENCYRQMYNEDIMMLTFKSKEDAKQHIDLFLDKLNKLKAFL